ncbi:TlpA family protein disulfide reductase [Luteolibacter pohnpeiensis]|uniref:TlpA family protein disulfide reductase n=1 Tax=Luteolibacter pohnpeiensis TaxID=454153 RepID=A0A934S8G1_9BACT|nr:TlpA disulfide reductase family protein [Luteolibacter pohnpeiensis]MBK1883260.1 TlpA family protein disulfide reductase [Luteolibacter pohnpeiensis]
MKFKTLIALGITAASCLTATAQKEGDSVTPEVFGKLDWIQGSAPTQWESGKVYMFECWATWCMPCVLGIPHVDALYDKYHDKGFEVYGMDVFEDGKDKVAEFVAKKGDGMSYPVAYTGRGGVFETEWLKPAEVNSIPRALVVKDGKVLLNIHPTFITDEVVEGLLAGGDAQEKALASIETAKKNVEIVQQQREAFAKANSAHDGAAMEVAFNKIKELDPKNAMLPTMDLQVKVAKKDWAALDNELMSTSEDKRPVKANVIAQLVSWMREDIPEDLFRKLLEPLQQTNSTGRRDPIAVFQASKLQWLLGDKEQAVKTADEALEIAKNPVTPQAGTPYLVFLIRPYSEKLHEGEMPTEEELSGWLKEGIKNVQLEMQKKAAEKAAAAKAAAEKDSKE